MKQNTNRKRINKRTVLHVIIAILCIGAIGIIVEFFENYRELSLDKSQRELQEISAEKITYTGFHEKDGALVFDHDYGVIHIELGGQYVKKLGYQIRYDGLLKLDAHVGIQNPYGEVRENDELHIEDYHSKLIDQSWLNIGKKVDYVNLVIRQEDLNIQDLGYLDFESFELAFEHFYINNIPVLNLYRLCVFWCVLGISTMLWFGRPYFARNIERGFLFVALSVGVLLILALPANKVSWDEEIHFERAFWLAGYPKKIPVSDALLQEFSAGIDTWPMHQPDGIEEQKSLNQYLDSEVDYRNGRHQWSVRTDQASVQGYLGSMLLLRIGKLLGVSFSVLFRMGRLGNLLVYSLLMYFAIKITPVGKGIMTFLALMPTPMFLASVYAYDPTVTACIYLAIAFMLKEILSGIGKINWKHYVCMLLVFYIGCRAKAVYAPLVLFALLIPKERFLNKRQMIWMRLGVVFVFLVLMGSFILPTLIAPSEVGDLRGGDTSQVGQMSYIFGQPFIYAGILIRSILESLPDFLIGNGSLGVLGHLGNAPFGWMLPVGALLVTLTNTQCSGLGTLNGKHKFVAFLLSGICMALIWTSMYLVYTVPGESRIAGVQGRYYIPLLFLVYMIFNSRKITVQIKTENYYALVLGGSAVILLANIFAGIIVPFCL